jgi:hypothetical protein
MGTLNIPEWPLKNFSAIKWADDRKDIAEVNKRDID